MKQLVDITNPAINPRIGNTATIPAGGAGHANILQLFLTNFISIALGAAGVIAFIMLLAGGIQWIIAGGDKEAMEHSRRRITGALIGLAIVFSVFAIIFLAENIFGIPITKFTIPVIQ